MARGKALTEFGAVLHAPSYIWNKTHTSNGKIWAFLSGRVEQSMEVEDIGAATSNCHHSVLIQ
jgi:ABC-type molybdate transport system permease subunit